MNWKFLGVAVVIGALSVFSLVSSVEPANPFADEPTTIIRHRGKAGLAERVESRGKAAKENTVRVRLDKTIGDVVIQKRIVVKGSDVFESKPTKERKETAKERPQPASVKPLKAKVGR